jgi:predicted AlkP superfamily phosphohydrolase/phosphomutase
MIDHTATSSSAEPDAASGARGAPSTKLRDDGSTSDGGAGRVLLIGLDAADAGILMSGIEAGTLPRLRRLRDEGAWGIVTSPAGFGSGAVWPSFATGVSPAKHGRYFYRQVGPGSYSAEKFEADQLAVPPVWEHIARSGRSVAVFDVPKVGLPLQSIDGVVAVDWISHGPVYTEMRSFPAGFGDDLTTRFGRNELWKCDLPGGRDAEQMGVFVEQLRERVHQRERATRHYWSEGYDLLITVFAEPHCVGHQGWHVRDRHHPMHDADALRRIGDPVDLMYREIDTTIGRIIDAVDDDTTVIVFSGTGMGPNYTGNHLLDDVLRAIDHKPPTTMTALTKAVKKRLKKVLPPELRRRGQRLKNRVEEQAFATDRARRPSFAVPHNDIAGAVRLNIVGREPTGVLRPDEVDAYVERLRGELLALRNADTGARVVTDVVRVADEHHGEWLDRLPDLLVVWNRDEPIDRVTSDSIGTVEYSYRGNRTGDHSPDNVFFAVGPSVTPGRCEGVALYDFASTLCRLVGAPIPSTDGEPIDALTARPPARLDRDAADPSTVS